MKKNLLLSTLFLLFSFWAWSQQVQISGVVKSATDNLPLPGASVIIKGTVTGTTTDINGKYTIKANVKEVLVYSFVGMNPQEIAVTADSKTIDVVLAENAVLMQEVVVVGYGTQKKSVVTGAISSVKAKDLEKTPNGRVEQALQGRVSGVTVLSNSGQPGDAATIRVRGITTFGNTEPLWVIDGIIFPSGGIGDLNQADIASIEVLKDAASAAIYGTRAAAGVILVTTKKGQSGKMQVNYNASFGSSSPAKVLTLCNATQYAALINERQTNGGLDIKFPNIGQYGEGTDWQKEIFNTNAGRTTHELSFSGGNDKSTFYSSVNISNQEGIVLSEISKFNKLSFRLNSDHKISKVFSFGQTFGYTHTKSVGIGNTNSEFGGPLSSAINLDPITPVLVMDPVLASQAPYDNVHAIRDANGNPYGMSPNVGQEMTNPLAYAQTKLGQYNWSDAFKGNAYLEVNVNKHLKFRTSAGASLAYWGWQGFTPLYLLNQSTSNLVFNNYSRTSQQGFDWNLENTVAYSNKIQDHEFSVLLGQGAYLSGIGFGSSNTVQGLPISSYEDASFSFDIPQAQRSSGIWDFTEHRVSSVFGRANYNYKEKYLFTGIIRRDGSTKFGANYKFGLFPSFSLGWVVSSESFWKTNNVVNSLKIRGGYGVVGNDNMDDFRYLSTVRGGYNYTLGYPGSIVTGYAPATLDNPDLHWEQTSQLNFGFDARFLTNFNIVFEVFKKRTTGILRPIPIPGYVGVSEQPWGNVADMDNKGAELELGYNKTIGDVTFSANGNVAYLKNEVTYVNSDRDFIPGGASFQSMGPVTRVQVGQSYNSFYGYKTDGIFQNWSEIKAYVNPTTGELTQPKAVPGDWKWVDTNGDGTITEDDKTFLGTSIPKWTYGLTLNAAYKGFDLLVFAQGAGGNKIFQGLRRLDIEYSNWQTTALDRWTGEGTSNTYPRLTAKDDNENFGKMSDFYLEKGDYLRLKNIQLGYTIKSDLLKKISVNKFRLYVQAENLFTFTKYTGYDPEIGGGVFGIDKGLYPQARSFIAGLQLQF